MSKKNIPVSILCANYNNSPFLYDFFESILNSTVIPNEIIIVDDCSTDNSISIIQTYQAKFDNLRLFTLKKNIGFANALNFGLEKVATDYIVRIDPDDIFHTNRLKKQWEYLQENPKVDLVGSNVTYFSENVNNNVGSSNFPKDYHEIKSRYRQGYHGLVHGSVMIKSKILKEKRYFQDHVPAEEYDLFSRILTDGYVTSNLREELTFVRVHNSSATHNYPISTFKKICYLQQKHWGIEISTYNFYRKYLMIFFYRKSLTNSFLKQSFFRVLTASLAPDLIINRLKKR